MDDKLFIEEEFVLIIDLFIGVCIFGVCRRGGGFLVQIKQIDFALMWRENFGMLMDDLRVQLRFRLREWSGNWRSHLMVIVLVGSAIV